MSIIKITKTPLWKSVLISMILATIIGFLLGEEASKFEVLGVIFFSLIKMLTPFLVFFSLIYGMINVERESMRRTTFKALIIFISTAIFAVFIGLAVTHVMKPGFAEGKESIKSHLLQLANKSDIEKSTIQETFKEQSNKVVSNIVPTNIIEAFLKCNIIQIIFLAFFSSFVILKYRERYSNLVNTCNEIADLMFKMISIIMKMAPIGVFGYISSLVGSQGMIVFGSLLKFILTVSIACILQYLLFGVIITVFGRISPLPFFKKIAPIQLLAFSTSSSKATLVPLMELSETQMGISKGNSRFLLPLSAVLNMDGGAIYQASCAMFFMQIFDMQITYIQYGLLIFMCTVASIGGAGIPGGVMLFLGMVLTSIGLPAEGIILIAAIDRILDMMTTLINVTGDACAVLIIDSSDKKLDRDRYYS